MFLFHYDVFMFSVFERMEQEVVPVNLWYLFLVVLSFISLGLSGCSFFASLILAGFSGSKKGWFTPLIYLVLLMALFLFWGFVPGGADYWTTVIYLIICMVIQYCWVGKCYRKYSGALKYSLLVTLLTTSFLLGSLIIMGIAAIFAE